MPAARARPAPARRRHGPRCPRTRRSTRAGPCHPFFLQLKVAKSSEEGKNDEGTRRYRRSASIASQILAAMSGPPSRATARMPVGGHVDLGEKIVDDVDADEQQSAFP